MFPFFAQGAAQSIEDAAVLAACLASAAHGPERALRRYETLRSARTTRLQEESRRRARINHLPDGPEQRARDEAMQNSDPLVRSGEEPRLRCAVVTSRARGCCSGPAAGDDPAVVVAGRFEPGAWSRWR